ncbi:hypothetical protein [Streptomyces sp. NPDC053079]|uniref:hypothetical protein n=1 Tax=Streptomyces sp. NPDC053079 TaxID=3365697 RepID=UPI0037CCFF8C
MPLTHHAAYIKGPQPIEGAEGLASVEVSFVPADQSDLLITWQYVYREGEAMQPCGFKVEPAPGVAAGSRQQVGATVVRELPLARLERAARGLFEFSYRGPREGVVRMGKQDAATISEAAQAMVRELHPDLDEMAGAGAARRWKRLVRLAEVVQEYQMALARGDKSPAATVAEARGVAPATVRSWVHQARKEGFDTVVDLNEFTHLFPGVIERVVVNTDRPGEPQAILSVSDNSKPHSTQGGMPGGSDT